MLCVSKLVREHVEIIWGWDDWMIRWSDDQMTGWCDAGLTGWRNDRMTEWQDDLMTGWLDDSIMGWRNDQMIGWREALQTIDRMIYLLFQYLVLCHLWSPMQWWNDEFVSGRSGISAFQHFSCQCSELWDATLLMRIINIFYCICCCR